MRITILNGSPEEDSGFDTYTTEYAAHLEALGNEVTHLQVRDLELKGCTGCWGCWVKTPGECVRGDDSSTICRAVMDSDITVLASPMRMGFTSALLKRAADQMIALVHPYIVVEGGEMHHRPRYARYPKFGLLLGPAADTDAEDIAITTHMWSRAARNMKSSLVFTAVDTFSAKEAADELAATA